MASVASACASLCLFYSTFLLLIVSVIAIYSEYILYIVYSCSREKFLLFIFLFFSFNYTYFR